MLADGIRELIHWCTTDSDYIVDIRVILYNHRKLNVAVYQQFLQISTEDIFKHFTCNIEN